LPKNFIEQPVKLHPFKTYVGVVWINFWHLMVKLTAFDGTTTVLSCSVGFSPQIRLDFQLIGTWMCAHTVSKLQLPVLCWNSFSETPDWNNYNSSTISSQAVIDKYSSNSRNLFEKQIQCHLVLSQTMVHQEWIEHPLIKSTVNTLMLQNLQVILCGIMYKMFYVV